MDFYERERKYLVVDFLDKIREIDATVKEIAKHHTWMLSSVFKHYNFDSHIASIFHIAKNNSR